MTPEQIVERYLVKRVTDEGGYIRKLSWIGVNGAPDRFIAYKGKVYLVECKSKTGRLRAMQEAEIRRLSKQGIAVSVINSKEGVDDFIKGMVNGII